MYVESAMDLGAISADDGRNLGAISGDLGDEIEENSISLEELLWEVDELRDDSAAAAATRASAKRQANLKLNPNPQLNPKPKPNLEPNPNQAPSVVWTCLPRVPLLALRASAASAGPA